MHILKTPLRVKTTSKKKKNLGSTILYYHQSNKQYYYPTPTPTPTQSMHSVLTDLWGQGLSQTHLPSSPFPHGSIRPLPFSLLPPATSPLPLPLPSPISLASPSVPSPSPLLRPSASNRRLPLLYRRRVSQPLSPHDPILLLLPGIPPPCHAPTLVTCRLYLVYERTMIRDSQRGAC